jgi:hypothetical protein
MPEIADYLNQYLPMAMPYVDKIPGATATIDVGGEKIPYAQSNLLGEPQNLGKAYLAKLDQLERERRISPMKRRMEEYRLNLAKQLNQSMFGMTPEAAETNAHTVGAGSILANRLMSSMETEGILPVFEKGMVDFGVTNPAVAGSAGQILALPVGETWSRGICTRLFLGLGKY